MIPKGTLVKTAVCRSKSSFILLSGVWLSIESTLPTHPETLPVGIAAQNFSLNLRRFCPAEYRSAHRNEDHCILIGCRRVPSVWQELGHFELAAMTRAHRICLRRAPLGPSE